MKEKLTPYLKKLAHKESIQKQYISESQNSFVDYNDPLQEDAHEVVKGLIHKYKNRALIKVSYLCAAHCRFCTRIRQIGNPVGTLSESDVSGIVDYLKVHTEIEDVILSGGDPFFTPKITEVLLSEIAQIKSVKVIRIGTRLPLQSPESFKSKSLTGLLETVNEMSKQKPFYLLLHVNHPDELTDSALAAINVIKYNTQVTLLSQTVFLKGINIDFETLYSLFTGLYFAGVTPYYIYHCDTVRGLEPFVGDIESEIKGMQKLRDSLSGIAYPSYIVDLENGTGKYPVDLGIVKITANKVYKQ